MNDQIKATVATIMVGAFGLFLIWKGITGDVVRTAEGKEFIPRWLYVLIGLVVLILPVTYIIARIWSAMAG